MYIIESFSNPVYWQKDFEPIDLIDNLEDGKANEQENEEVSFIDSVKAVDHPFDKTAYQKNRCMCDYPVKTATMQFFGEQGPRFYNRQTPDQQAASFVNTTVKSML